MSKKWGSVDFKELKQLRERLEKLTTDRDEFCHDCAKELASRLLKKVVNRTPVGEYEPITYTKADGTTITYNDAKQGGELRRSWHIGTISQSGGVYTIEVSNNTEYASYVEFGHRQEPGRFVPHIGRRLKSAWVEGRFMLTISENEIQSKAPRLLEKRLHDKLREALNDK